MPEINDTIAHVIRMRRMIEDRERRERVQRDADRQDSIDQLPTMRSGVGARRHMTGGLCREDIRQDRAPIFSAHDAREAMIRRGRG